MIDHDGNKVACRLAKANRCRLESLLSAVEQELHSWRYGERIHRALLLIEETCKK
ncbi:MAG TPA: hypothetical protein PKI03_18245 [Pseudomonadota bacterium]|nr:hypothetical protein [Pseudomonadota bacterium]